MASLTKKRVIAAACGFAYALIYGFWTALLTGGGHGNFIWLLLFLFIEFFGLYFPLMSFLLVDLRSTVSKVIFGTLIFFNLIASSIMLHGWITDAGENGKPSDFSKMVQLSGMDDIVIAAVAHYLPTVIFLVFLIKSIFFGTNLPDDDPTVLSLS